MGRIYFRLGIPFLFLLFSSGVFFPGRLRAQQPDSSYWRDIEYIQNRSPWLKSGNAAGLGDLSVKKISRLSASYSKSNGSFMNYYQSNNSWNYNVATQSYYRLNSHTVFQGEVSYTNFQGKNMQGSVFLDPYQSPLDIDEYADTTAGTKKLEYYHLLGAVSVQLHPKWTVGGKINYNAANYTKIKDMRHVNNLLFLEAEGGINYKITPKDEVGISFGYKRRTESISFTIAGNKDRQYTSLINFGTFYGDAELHSENGYTANENPSVGQRKFSSLFYNHSFSQNVQWLNELTFGKRTGYFGKKGSTSIVYTEYKADQYSYKSILSLKDKTALHNFTLYGAYSHLKNSENVYQKETSDGGNTVIAYYGSNEVFNQKITKGSLAYEGFLKLTGSQPRWKLKAGVDYFRREQTTTLYPYYRLQTLNSYRLYVTGLHNWLKGKEMYTVGIHAGYGSGFGTPKDDRVYASGSASAVPASRDRYLYQEYEYFTKPRLAGALELGYNYNLGNSTAIYSKIEYMYTQAFKVQHTGKDFKTVSLHIGYNF